MFRCMWFLIPGNFLPCGGQPAKVRIRTLTRAEKEVEVPNRIKRPKQELTPPLPFRPGVGMLNARKMNSGGPCGPFALELLAIACTSCGNDPGGKSVRRNSAVGDR
ncbi:hypothetical protein THAOC_34898 [Thalassiosira oceanica]|uniref:Uncharacterized protein n=1 Tax=Thalassiosira oceanica TaxID=159749 RepID=K0R1R9_THAOC|nr:hypothetical protein THAOC_34898 [Thalassiosira oceanica]|eukprot:EJK46433.1 hypothetical protein THAOC_34898 [Thalassiosira oceanica]